MSSEHSPTQHSAKPKKILIALVHKQYIRPLFTYTRPAWQPDTAETHIQNLQCTQNRSLQTATDCTQTYLIPHLHIESLVLPLKQNILMRGTQIYTSTNCPIHPLNQLQSAIERMQTNNTNTAHYSCQAIEVDSLPPIPDNT